MTITKIAMICAAFAVGGIFIWKKHNSSKETNHHKKTVFEIIQIDNISYDHIIADIKKIYKNKEDYYKTQQCKMQILGNASTLKMYSILKDNDSKSIKLNTENPQYVACIFYVNKDIEHVIFYNYKTIDSSLNDIFSSGNDIFEQNIE